LPTAPQPSPYPHALPSVCQSQQPPFTDLSTNPNTSTDTPEQSSAPPPSTLNELQTQLHDTQSRLANLEHEYEGEPDGEEEEEEEEELGRPRTPEPTGMGMGIHGMDDYESRRLLETPQRHSASPGGRVTSSRVMAKDGWILMGRVISPAIIQIWSCARLVWLVEQCGACSWEHEWRWHVQTSGTVLHGESHSLWQRDMT
jgi:hypothetical protein